MNQFTITFPTDLDVEKLLPWSAAREQQVTDGTRMIREAQADDLFWHLWNKNQPLLASQGIAVAGQTVLWITGQPKKAQPVITKPVVPQASKLDPFRDVPLPGWIKPLLYDYQRPCVYDLVEGFKVWPAQLDASEMGLGKTFHALGAAAVMNRVPIVICRKAAFSSWRRCADHFGYKSLTVVNYELVRRGNTPLGHWGKVKGLNNREYDAFVWTLPTNALLILDEQHWCRRQGTQNQDLSLAATRQKIYTLNITATAGNNPSHMRALGFSLGLFPLKEYYSWLYRNGCSEGKFGMEFTCGMEPKELFQKVGDEWIPKPDGQRRLQQLQAIVLQSIHGQIFHNKRGVRVSKAEIGFPVSQIIPVIIDFEDSETKIKNLYRDIQARIERMGDNKKINRLAVITAERIEIERLKMDWLVDEAQNLVESGNHVAIFVNFNESVDLLCKKLKTTCCVRGGQSPAERDRCIDRFQADKEPIIICNIQAGGESISLHDLHGNFPRVSLIFPTFWAEALKQVLGRIDRKGVKTPTVQKIIFAAHTIEEHQAKSIERKLANISLLNDADLSGGIRLLN